MSQEYELVDGRWYVGGKGAGREPAPLSLSEEVEKTAVRVCDRLFAEWKPSPRARFVAWVSHRPLVMVGILGFLCGAALMAAYELI